jgi:S1-C subfamily serine protease
MEFEHTEIIPETPPVAEIATEIITPPVTDSRWKGTIVRMIPCIVSIRSVAVRSFDTETSRTSQATGFVVDCKQGIILTNRHVVQPGPILAEAIFSIGKEEVKLTPIYRDPLHDFGFFKFDVNSLKYAEISQINLRPDLAHVGLEIRVVANFKSDRK